MSTDSDTVRILWWNAGTGDVSKVFGSYDALKNWVKQSGLKREWVNAVIYCRRGEQTYTYNEQEIDLLIGGWPKKFKIELENSYQLNRLKNEGFEITPA